jgi:hypothetical protein
MRKVKSGDPLRIRADDYNAFVDAAEAHKNRMTAPPSAQQLRESGDTVLVRNDSGQNIIRFGILGIDGPLVEPAANLERFKNRTVLKGVIPITADHSGKFVITQEPIRPGKIGRALISGVSAVQVLVLDEDAEDYQYADVFEPFGEWMIASPTGSASILWRESGLNIRWALVRIGNIRPTGVFPVKLTKVGGTHGDDTTPTTYTYDVSDIITDDVLETAVDPTADPHQWKRPTIGVMMPATFGYAHYRYDSASYTYELVLGWINEMGANEACDDTGGT